MSASRPATRALALESVTGTFDNVTSTPANGPSVPFVVNENVNDPLAGHDAGRAW